ncbi:hypothetical protein [Caulobacter sp. DWR2-3-1b2]|uniref:hypothetical protein n=1 Tax=unclassified Caulobacter TaxID=2648921 RepID=UPI0019889C0D|nr:hypothetical protein [Caulobacter sp.]
MTVRWRIDVRLGDAPPQAPLRSMVVEAPTEVEALRLVLVQAEQDRDNAAELLQDGQEEVFSRTEVEGRTEHQGNTD